MGSKQTNIEIVFKKRIVYMTVLLFVCFAVILTRLFFLQVVHGESFRAQADGQRTSDRKLLPARGEIKINDKYSGKPYVVATSIQKPLVFANPSEIANPSEVAEKLSAIIGVEKESIIAKLSDSFKKYVVLKRQISEEDRQMIESLGIAGIHFDSETMRYYPESTFLSQLLGFVGYNKDNQRTGLYGIEQAFNDELSGKEGWLSQEKDISGTWIFGSKRDHVPAVDGENLLLTIDKTVQFKAESVLKEAVEINQADSGSVIIMDPKTGAIIGMASYPTYDPNQYSKVEDVAIFNNMTTLDSYEPGSIFKPLTMAAAVNEKKVGAQTTYTDPGEINIDGYTIKNSDGKAHGLQTMSQVLEESLNTGVIYAKDRIGNKKFAEYVKRFGFGKKTGIEVSESKGDLSGLNGNIAVNYHTASFGQGISVTPVQMVQSFSALANGGKMMKPYVVASIEKNDGKLEETKPSVIDQVIARETASEVSAMLVNVVEKGHGKRAGVPGYYVAGKTGTAQVPRKDGKGYEANNNIGSFIGYAPVEDPKFVMLVRINHPRTVSFAESTAAPAFGKMAQFLLTYYNVPPNRTDQINKK
jgi:cell division protein FtsI/penicillin-binding protein 2